MTTDRPASPATTHPDNSHTTRRVQAPGGDLYVIDQPGAEPAIVLLHGFPTTGASTKNSSRTWYRAAPSPSTSSATAIPPGRSTPTPPSTRPS